MFSLNIAQQRRYGLAALLAVMLAGSALCQEKPEPAANVHGAAEAKVAPAAVTPATSRGAQEAPAPAIVALMTGGTFKNCKAPLRDWAIGQRSWPLGGTCTAAGNTVLGADDIVLVVTHWRDPTPPTKLSIWINGVEMSENATIAATEHIGTTSFVGLHLRPGKQTQMLWSNMIRTAGLTTPIPLSVELGWTESARSTIISSAFSSPDTMIAVTTEFRLRSAAVLLVLFGGFGLIVAMRFGLLRDKPKDLAAELIAEAAQLRRNLPLRGTARQEAIRAYYPSYSPNIPGSPKFNPGLSRNVDPACLAAAEKALISGLPDTSAGSRQQAIAGIIEGRRSWSYSLAATQLLLWFAFAVLGGLYFWVVYGEMPIIEDSVLGLVGISAGTAAVSWVIDSTPLRQPGTVSHGFFSDLVTDPSNDTQIHRYQCVFVNAVLLMVGIANIVYDVAYPIFDKSWLIFVTISGVTYTAGKQTKEGVP